MRVPLEISFRGVAKTDDMENLIWKKVAKLEELCDHLSSLSIAIESPQEHQQAGNPFRVRISMRVPPGHELVVKRESSRGDMHDPLPKVVRDAFQAARRQIKELTDRQQGEVKTHPEQEAAAIVVRLFREEGYGFLKTIEGRELYFHRNSVLHGDFDRLEIGTGVSFVEEAGEKGPQASTLQIVDKPGSRVTEEEESEAEPPLGWKK
ncbi:MAG: HPF/RaiA family ribosome-associated protein [Thermodesulfobacteriota bacterium]